MKSAVVYGCSHAQPTGMGDDMVEALKARGIQVKRLGLQGRNDAKLLAEAGQLGDVSGYDHVFLYAGDNADTPTPEDLRKLVEYFGAKRTTVILSPVNLGGTGNRAPDVRKQINTANRGGVQDIVTVYEVEAPATSFKSDGIHLKGGSPESKALANAVLADLGEGGAPKTQAAGLSPLLIGALVLGALLLLRRRQNG